MPRRRQSVSPMTEGEVLSGRINALQKAVSAINQAKMTTIQVVDIVNFNDPIEGMVCVDWPTKRYCWYHDGEWICVPPDATHAIKVYGDRQAGRVENGAFRFSIELDLDNTKLIWAGAFLGTTGTGNYSVQISNQTKGVDMLSSNLVVPSGQYDSFGTTPSINSGGPVANPNNRVLFGDRIWIDVDSIGTGKGLGVYMTFTPFRDPQSDIA